MSSNRAAVLSGGVAVAFAHTVRFPAFVRPRPASAPDPHVRDEPRGAPKAHHLQSMMQYDRSDDRRGPLCTSCVGLGRNRHSQWPSTDADEDSKLRTGATEPRDSEQSPRVARAAESRSRHRRRRHVGIRPAFRRRRDSRGSMGVDTRRPEVRPNAYSRHPRSTIVIVDPRMAGQSTDHGRS